MWSNRLSEQKSVSFATLTLPYLFCRRFDTGEVVRMAVPFRERVLDPKPPAKRPNNFMAERCTFEIVRSGRTLASHVAATSASAITFVAYVIYFFLQAGALFAQSPSPSSENYEDELRKIQESRQKLEEELSHFQS